MNLLLDLMEHFKSQAILSSSLCSMASTITKSIKMCLKKEKVSKSQATLSSYLCSMASTTTLISRKCVQGKKKPSKKDRQFCHHICAAWHQPLQSLSKMFSREEIVFFSWRPISVNEQKTGWEKFPQRWVRSVQIFCRYLYVLFFIKYIKCKC